MGAIISLLSLAITVYIWIIIIQVLVHWLIIFELINADNPQARKLLDLLKKVTDPVYQPLRKFIPPIGGIDITPIIVILGLSFLQNIIVSTYHSMWI